MRLAYEFAGSDRLLFASDHPWVEIDVLSRLVEDMDICMLYWSHKSANL